MGTPYTKSSKRLRTTTARAQRTRERHSVPDDKVREGERGGGRRRNDESGRGGGGGGKRGLRKDRVGCTTPAEEEAGEREGIVNIDNNNSKKTRNTMVWTPRQSTSYHP